MEEKQKTRLWDKEGMEMIYSHDPRIADYFNTLHITDDPIQRFVVMEMLKFKDNTGKDIYEEDILSIKDEISLNQEFGIFAIAKSYEET